MGHGTPFPIRTGLDAEISMKEGNPSPTGRGSGEGFSVGEGPRAHIEKGLGKGLSMIEGIPSPAGRGLGEGSSKFCNLF